MTSIADWKGRFSDMSEDDLNRQIEALETLRADIKDEFELNILLSIAKLVRDYPDIDLKIGGN